METLRKACWGILALFVMACGGAGVSTGGTNGGTTGGTTGGGGGGGNPYAGSYVGSAPRWFGDGSGGWVPASGGVKSALGTINTNGQAMFTVLNADGAGHSTTVSGAVANDGAFTGTVTYWTTNGTWFTVSTFNNTFGSPSTWQVEYTAGGNPARIRFDLTKQP